MPAFSPLTPRRQRVIAGLFAALIAAPCVDARAQGKSFFFATRSACLASGLFKPRECDFAFANAQTELRERAPSFVGKFDCVLRFHLCERRLVGAAEGVAAPIRYAPEMLGVEISDLRDGGKASPVLAVASPPGLLRAHPIERLYVAPPHVVQTPPPSATLRADRFEPFAVAAPARGWTPFVTRRNDDDAQASLQRARAAAYDAGDAQDEAPDSEAESHRRERLRRAPFVE
jgi:hypothetical protein